MLRTWGCEKFTLWLSSRGWLVKFFMKVFRTSSKTSLLVVETAVVADSGFAFLTSLDKYQYRSGWYGLLRPAAIYQPPYHPTFEPNTHFFQIELGWIKSFAFFPHVKNLVEFSLKNETRMINAVSWYETRAWEQANVLQPHTNQAFFSVLGATYKTEPRETVLVFLLDSALKALDLHDLCQLPTTTLQSMMNAKLSLHRFWPCHETGLIETIQTIPHNP